MSELSIRQGFGGVEIFRGSCTIPCGLDLKINFLPIIIFLLLFFCLSCLNILGIVSFFLFDDVVSGLKQTMLTMIRYSALASVFSTVQIM